MLPSRHVLRTAVAMAALALALPSAAQLPAWRIVVADRLAHPGAMNAGALFSVDPAADPASSPAVLEAADTGAPFEDLSRVAVSTVDGSIYVADVSDVSGGRIFSVDEAGTIRTLTNAVAASDLTVLPDGRLVATDLDADPSGLGPDAGGNAGHGAVFIIDPITGAASLLSDGTRHDPFPGAGASAFEDPLAVAYDPGRDVIYVADITADPLGQDADPASAPFLSTVYAVDPVSGHVSLASADLFLVTVVGLDVRADGTLVAADQGDGVVRPAVAVIDPSAADLQANVSLLSESDDFGILEDVLIDRADQVFVMDSGVWDDVSMTFLVPPALFVIDETVMNPRANAVIVSEALEFSYPVSASEIPAFTVTRVEAPAALPTSLPGGCAAVPVIVEGEGLSPGMIFDAGGSATASGVVAGAAFPVGTRVVFDVVPSGVAGVADVTIRRPFGQSVTLPAALFFAGDASALVPGPPCSTRGDATCDGFVDGLDLALLGRHFGTTWCEGLAFDNDADFDDDDVIDGADLAILATFFATPQ